MLSGSRYTICRIPLGRWKGKNRYFTITLPGKPFLTAKQLNDWFHFAEIEPFGEYRNELRHGQLMALHANLNRDEKHKREPFTATDFMNFIEREPERELTPEELEAHFDKIFG